MASLHISVVRNPKTNHPDTSMLSKQKVYSFCLQLINEKINFLKQTIADLTKGGENDAKSSAGDKHETARAMLQAEQEKLSKQLGEVMEQRTVLEKINPSSAPSQVSLGSLVKTDKGYLFLSVALGKIKVDNIDVITLSPASPLGIKLMAVTSGQAVHINTVKYLVEEII